MPSRCRKTEGDSATVEALTRSVAEEFERYAKVKKNIPEEALAPWPKRRSQNVWLTLSQGISVSRSTRSRRFWRRWMSERLEKVYGLMQGEMSCLQVEKEDQDPRQVPDGAHAARVLSERADEGDPEGAGRRAKRPERSWPSSKTEHQAPSCPKRPEKKPMPSSRKLKSMSPDVG